MSADGVQKQSTLDEFIELLVFIEVKWEQSDLDRCGLPEQKLRQIVAQMRELIIEEGIVRAV